MSVSDISDCSSIEKKLVRYPVILSLLSGKLGLSFPYSISVPMCSWMLSSYCRHRNRAQDGKHSPGS